MALLRYFFLRQSTPTLLHKWPKSRFNLQGTVFVTLKHFITEVATEASQRNVMFRRPSFTKKCNTVRIRFKKLLNKKEIRFKKEFLGTKIQFTVVHDSI